MSGTGREGSEGEEGGRREKEPVGNRTGREHISFAPGYHTQHLVIPLILISLSSLSPCSPSFSLFSKRREEEGNRKFFGYISRTNSHQSSSNHSSLLLESI